jgi:uncharacterized protein
MAKFRISAVKPGTKDTTIFWYDNMSSLIFDETGKIIEFPSMQNKEHKFFPVQTSINSPAFKTRDVKVLKIQLGLSCNYECSYCNQRFVPHADETTKDDVSPFLETLPTWMNGDGSDLKVEFWGGEPFVYWKTLQPLAEGIRTMYPKAEFSVVTNGTILDLEKNKWLDDMGFSVGVSHDGPGYHVRGLDPFDNAEQLAMIIDLWNRLGSKGRMSFNAMVHKDNPSRANIEKWFKDRLGFDVPIGEGAFIDPYDEGGKSVCMTDPADHINFRNNALNEIREGRVKNFSIINKKITGFIDSVLTKRPASTLGQKCGMDDPNKIAVDLKGNVLTCQNVSAVATGFNGESHLIGNVNDFDNIKLKTSTHWSHRKECPECPVLQICQGSCMFLHGDMWNLACDNAYSDNIPYFMAAWEVLTGTIPYYIDGDFDESRKDISGIINGIPEPKTGKKIINIQPV